MSFATPSVMSIASLSVMNSTPSNVILLCERKPLSASSAFAPLQIIDLRSRSTLRSLADELAPRLASLDYDMIALLTLNCPSGHHNLAKPIITAPKVHHNLPARAIIVGKKCGALLTIHTHRQRAYHPWRRLRYPRFQALLPQG